MFSVDQNITEQNSLKFSSSQHDPNYIQMKTDKASLEVQVLKLKQQFCRLNLMYQEELEQCKDDLQKYQLTVNQLEEMNSSLKTELNSRQSESFRALQDCERMKRQMEKLRIDNEGMEMQLEEYHRQRKIYSGKVDECKLLQGQTASKLAHREKLYQESFRDRRQLDRQINQDKITIEQQNELIIEKDHSLRELKSELQNSLQAQMASSSLASSLQRKLMELDDINKRLEFRLNQVEDEREEVQDKLQEYETQRGDASSSSEMERTMLEIRSFMKHINLLMDQRRDGKDRDSLTNKKLKQALLCLERNAPVRN